MRWGLAFAAALLSASGCIDVQGLTAAPLAPEVPLADALLDPGDYPRLVVEVSMVAGYQLAPSALLAFQTELANLTGRTDIAYTRFRTIEPQGGDYDAADLRALHAATVQVNDPDQAVRPGRVGLHLMVLDGRSETADDHLVFGSLLARQGVIVVFPDVYETARRLADQRFVEARAEMDRHVLLHELGHAVGLVGAIPMVRDHEDPLHPGHSTNSSSLMFHRPPMERDGLVHGPRAFFDADDRADVAARRALLANVL